MLLRRTPIFAWAIFVAAWMMLLAFPSLVTGGVMLELDRAVGTQLFQAAGGGDPVLWQHLFWCCGHPEADIILIPALGIVSMVVPVLSRRPIAGYGLIVAALVAIGIVSFGLWVHHMFAAGSRSWR
jgi:heme/copper-type cytochrome/quinol oxidase subunit 1